MHFGERITERRLEQGLTREQLAERMNLTPEEIKAFETGKRKPDVFQMLALSDALRVRLRELIGKRSWRERRSPSRISFSETRTCSTS